jgi:hypothetical protein
MNKRWVWHLPAARRELIAILDAISVILFKSESHRTVVGNTVGTVFHPSFHELRMGLGLHTLSRKLELLVGPVQITSPQPSLALLGYRSHGCPEDSRRARRVLSILCGA